MRYLRTYWADSQSKLARYESFREEDDMTTVISGFLDLPVERFGFEGEWGDTSMFMGYSVQGVLKRKRWILSPGTYRKSVGCTL